jgi:tape measure domain-containing protein
VAVERIEIVVTERGTRVVRREIEQIGVAAGDAAGALSLLRSALAALGVVSLAAELARLADTFTQINNKLKSSGLEGEKLAAVYEKLRMVANETGAAFSSTVAGYQRVAEATSAMGLSIQDNINLIKTLNQAFQLGGATTTEAAQSMIQFGQALGKGIVNGDELNTILEAAPEIAKAIRKEFNVLTNGELKKLGEQGALVSTRIVKAMQTIAPELDRRFKDTSFTIDQALTIFGNQMIDYIGKVGQATGITKFFSDAIIGLGNNLDATVKWLTLVGAAVVVWSGVVQAAFMAVTRAVWAFTAALLANPFTALAAAITGIIAYFVMFRNEIKLGTDEITTFGDFLKAAWEVVGPIVKSAMAVIAEFFGFISKGAKEAFASMNLSVIGFLQVAASVVDSIIGVFKGAYAAIVAGWSSMGTMLKSIMIEIVNATLRDVENMVNGINTLLNPLLNLVGAGLGEVKLEIDNPMKADAEAAGATMEAAFAKGFNESNGTKDALKGVVTRAQQIAKDRAAAAALAGGPDLTQRGTAAPLSTDDDGKAAKARVKLQSELDRVVGKYDEVAKAARDLEKAEITLDKAVAAGLISRQKANEVLAMAREEIRGGLLNTYDEVRAAQSELAEAEFNLNEAVRVGLITQNERNKALETAKAQLRDQLDPLAAINRELDNELTLLGQESDEREVNNQIRQITNDLLLKGVTLTTTEVELLRTKLQLIQEETKVAQVRDEILASTIGKQEQFTRQLSVINQLLAEGKIKMTDATNALMQSGDMAELFEGTQDQLNAQTAAYQDMYSKIDQMRQANLVSEQTASQMRLKVAAMESQQRLQASAQFFGALAGLQSSGNRKIAMIGRAAAIAQATIDGIVAVQKALASTPPPMNYAVAAATGVMTAANVAQIASSPLPGFKTGGSFEVGGQGGTDSQTVAFRATPGEMVNVKRPGQSEDKVVQSAPPQVNVKVVNTIDPSETLAALGSGEGERIILNAIERNPSAIKRLLS